jgi:hypothetical protein
MQNAPLCLTIDLADNVVTPDNAVTHAEAVGTEQEAALEDHQKDSAMEAEGKNHHNVVVEGTLLDDKSKSCRLLLFNYLVPYFYSCNTITYDYQGVAGEHRTPTF